MKPALQEPFGHVTVRRLSQRFENQADQYHFYPAGQSPYLDNVDELHAVYTRPQAREPLTDEQKELLKWLRSEAEREDYFGNKPRASKLDASADMIEAAHGIK